MQNSDLYNFLSKQIQQNRAGVQSVELVKQVEKIAQKYLTKLEREKFYKDAYKDTSATVLKISMEK